jgi:hypothetical protein
MIEFEKEFRCAGRFTGPKEFIQAQLDLHRDNYFGAERVFLVEETELK